MVHVARIKVIDRGQRAASPMVSIRACALYTKSKVEIFEKKIGSITVPSVWVPSKCTKIATMQVYL